ncbi:MAG: hypothetical protein Q8K36_07245 [Alphaproteobacteria bacterium]|nr:hypothetical protein [Alphaproteobacteria bacterium]
MIINRMLFLAFLAIAPSFGLLGHADVSPPAASADRISCIQLLPYDATKEICKTPYDCKCNAHGDIPDPAKYKDIHGIDRTFSYVSPDSIPGGFGDQNIPGTHAYFLKHVVAHKKANFTKETKDDEKNTLFVRMECTFLTPPTTSGESTTATKPHPLVFNFYLGLFVSGRDDYYPQSGAKVSQILPSIPNSTPSAARELLDPDIAQSKKDTIKKFSQALLETSNADAIDIIAQNVEGVSLAILSPKRNFILEVKGGEKKRFIMQSGHRKLDDGGYFIARRFFPKPQIIPFEPRDQIFWNLFGRLRYDQMETSDSIILEPSMVLTEENGKEKRYGLGRCFFDSEQTFLSMLEAGSAPCETDVPIIAEMQHELLSTNLIFYSFRDMCRFCRGTFSHMLYKTYLQQRVFEFLKKQFDAGKLTVREDRDLSVIVFGHEETPKK